MEYTLNSNGVASVTLGPHDTPGDYPLIVKTNGTTVLDQTYPVVQTTYTATSSGSFTQYEQGTLTITAKRNGEAYSGAATIDGNATTFTNGTATYTTTFDTSGKQSLKLVIDGQTITLSVTVAPAKYFTVSANPSQLYTNETTSVTFTIKKNNADYSGAVYLTYGDGISGVNGTTAVNGIVKVLLTATSTGDKQVVIADADNSYTDIVSFDVVASIYALSASPNTLAYNTATAVTFTCKRNGNPITSGVSVTSFDGLSGGTTGAKTTNSAGWL